MSPMIGYALHDNMIVGGRFIYDRTLLRVEKARMSMGDDESGVDIGDRSILCSGALLHGARYSGGSTSR